MASQRVRSAVSKAMAKPIRKITPVRGGPSDKPVKDKGGKGKPAPAPEPVPESGAGQVAAEAQSESFRSDPGVQNRHGVAGSDGVGNVKGNGGFSSASGKPRFKVSDK